MYTKKEIEITEALKVQSNEQLFSGCLGSNHYGEVIKVHFADASESTLIPFVSYSDADGTGNEQDGETILQMCEREGKNVNSITHINIYEFSDYRFGNYDEKQCIPKEEAFLKEILVVKGNFDLPKLKRQVRDTFNKCDDISVILRISDMLK